MSSHLVSRIAGAAIGAAVLSAPVGQGAVNPPPPARHVPSTLGSAQELREQPLDTEVAPRPAPKPTPAPTHESARRKEPRANRLVRTPRDEDLPAWVPISGRLTVFESCDMAENLGLAPMGTARDGGCPSVAALLEQERLERLRIASEQ